MDWIKVKTRHILFEGMNAEVGWAWLKSMALTAQIETMPSEQQLKQIMHYKTLIALQRHFNDRSTSLQEVLNKVLMDVQRTVDLRTKSKEKMRQWREKKESVTSNDTSIDKIRVDKRREDKNTNTFEIDEKPKTTDVAKPSVKPLTDHQKIVEAFIIGYEKLSNGQKFKPGQKEYKIANDLVKKYGIDLVIEKAKLLWKFCNNRSVYFTEAGAADFTIGKLSSMWQQIIPESEDKKNGSRNGYTAGVSKLEEEQLLARFKDQ